MIVATDERRRSTDEPRAAVDGEVVTAAVLAEMGVALRQLRRSIEKARRQNEQVRDET